VRVRENFEVGERLLRSGTARVRGDARRCAFGRNDGSRGEKDGILKFRSSEVQEFKSSRVQEFRSSEARSFRMNLA